MHKRISALPITLAVASLLILVKKDPATVVFSAESAVPDSNASKHVHLNFPKHGTLSVEVIRTQDFEDTVRIRRQTRKLFSAHDLAGLEELGTKLCAEKRSLTTGGMEINVFFSAMQHLLNDDMPDSTWEEHLQILQDWAKQKPRSILAKTALMDFWMSYAWKARGSGYANTVSPDGWRLFSERLGTAQKLMADADNLPQTCPYLYRTELILARGNSWENSAMERVFAKSEHNFPGYLSSFSMKYAFLMPRWGGPEGACEKFFAECADKRGSGKEGDKFYAQLIWNLDAIGFEGWPIFINTTLSWERTKSGFEAMLKEKPDSISIISEFAKLANYADDKTTSRRLFDKIAMRCDPTVWSSGESQPQAKWYFMHAREKAYSDKKYADEKQDE